MPGRRPGHAITPSAAKSLSAAAASRTHGFPVPPMTFDPAVADARALAEYGFPPMPDKARLPRAHALWMSCFGRTLNIIAYKSGKRKMTLAPVSPVPPVTAPVGLSPAYNASSSNWSGAFLEANGGRTFRQIWGRWTVVTPRPPKDAARPDDGETPYEVSTWIGIDGQRLYRDSSLPQAGTFQALATDGSLKRDYHAWTQWWVHANPATGPVPIRDFPVSPGDVIRCVLTVLDPKSVLINFVNENASPPCFVAVRVEAPLSADGRPLEIAGSTAEWILERPSNSQNDTTLSPFPDYGTMNFTSCHVVTVDAASRPSETALRNGQFIRMYETKDDARRTASVSMPYRIDDTSFNVTYGGFRA
jgi:hypothetical protein